jgi:hypothetical protein
MKLLLTHEVQRCYEDLLEHFQGQGAAEDSDGGLSLRSGLKTIFDPGQVLAQDLEHIGHLIGIALHELHLDTPLMGTTSSKVNSGSTAGSAGGSARAAGQPGGGNKEESVNQQALLAIDAVCTAIAELEILLLKIEAVAASLEFHPRLVGNIAKYGFVSATTPAEAKIILSLAKCASFGQDSHSWHSFDGRELGIPKVGL